MPPAAAAPFKRSERRVCRVADGVASNLPVGVLESSEEPPSSQSNLFDSNILSACKTLFRIVGDVGENDFTEGSNRNNAKVRDNTIAK